MSGAILEVTGHMSVLITALILTGTSTTIGARIPMSTPTLVRRVQGGLQVIRAVHCGEATVLRTELYHPLITSTAILPLR